MYLHKQFIKEHITDTKAVNDFAFFLFLKTKTSNSVIYNTTTYVDIAKWVKMDRRTVKSKLEAIQARGWVKPSGDHIILKSINKDYEYRLKENGKPDKRKNSKYFRVKVHGKTLKQIKDIVRGLMVKPYYQKKLFVNVKDTMEHFSKKELKKVWSAAYNMGDKRKRGFLAEKSMVNIPIRLIGKAMGVSKSTAHRVVNRLSKDGMIIKESHEPVWRGFKDKLKKMDKLPYGIYTFNNNVYHKIVTSYAF